MVQKLITMKDVEDFRDSAVVGQRYPAEISPDPRQDKVVVWNVMIVEKFPYGALTPKGFIQWTNFTKCSGKRTVIG